MSIQRAIAIPAGVELGDVITVQGVAPDAGGNIDLSGLFVQKAAAVSAGSFNVFSNPTINTLGPLADGCVVLGGEVGSPNTTGNARLGNLSGYDNHIWDQSIANVNHSHHGITGGSAGHVTIAGGSLGNNFGGYSAMPGGTLLGVYANFGSISGTTNSVGANAMAALAAGAPIGVGDTGFTYDPATLVGRVPAVGDTVYIGNGSNAVSGPGGPLDRARVATVNTGTGVVTCDTFQAVSTTNVDGTSAGVAFAGVHPVGATVFFADGTNTGATALGGFNNHALNQYSTAGPGRDNTATALYSAAGPGHSNKATAQDSAARGEGALAYLVGQDAWSAGNFSVQGDAQISRRVTRSTTTDGAAHTLQLNGTVQLNCAEAWSLQVVAHDTATGDAKSWTIPAALLRRAATTTVTQVGGAPVPTVVQNDAGAAAWTFTVTTGSGTHNLGLTGEAGKTVRWLVEYVMREVI